MFNLFNRKEHQEKRIRLYRKLCSKIDEIRGVENEVKGVYEKYMTFAEI
ncbi:MAG TPA: hypothetical protein PLP27_05690 [Crocinitomicaceae bacterium]|nr:hypothetical protein [Crocinitomicaceae bacterium]